MNRLVQVSCVAVAVLFLCIGNAMALNFGANITIPDKNAAGSGWSGSQEDQEVEPGMVAAQYWDLEGFFLDGWMLTMIGGYDFVAGRDNFKSGDLFFDLTGDAQYGKILGPGDGNKVVTNTFGYDIVLDLDFTTKQYTAYALDGNTTTKTGYYKQNYGSSPWLYVDGGEKIKTGSFSYITGLSNDQTGLLGGSHNAVTFDLRGIIDPGTNFTSHFTMGCGNDNLMGNGMAPTPEPATMSLLALGLAGVAVYRRKREK